MRLQSWLVRGGVLSEHPPYLWLVRGGVLSEHPPCSLDFPGGSAVKTPPAKAGCLGSMPGLGRSPGEGNGNPLQDSGLETPMDRGAWGATVCGVAESDTTEQLHSNTGQLHCLHKPARLRQPHAPPRGVMASHLLLSWRLFPFDFLEVLIPRSATA